VLEKSLKVWFMQLFKCLNPALKIGFMGELIHMLFKHLFKKPRHILSEMPLPWIKYSIARHTCSIINLGFLESLEFAGYAFYQVLCEP